MHRHGKTQCAMNLAAYLRGENNIQEQTQNSSSSTRTNRRTERQPKLEQYVISHLRKQRLTGQDSLQEEIL